MTAEALARFGEVVVDDPGLVRELAAAPNRATFVALVVIRAGEHGYHVEPEDVEAGLRDRRRAWHAQWVWPGWPPSP